MKCFLERYLNKEDAERAVELLKGKGHNVYMECRFNTIQKNDVYHIIANCTSSEEYNLVKLALNG